MGQPKKRTSHRRTGARRSHLVQKLARRVNAVSPVKVQTSKSQTSKNIQEKASTSVAKS